MKVSKCLLGPFRVPTDRNWSKQHSRIRTPRPLVDRFNLGNLHPNKQWWRERRVAPATFMGFPDIAKAQVVGGSLYCEQMDAATLSVIAERTANDGIADPEVWSQLGWRAQQLCNSMNETDLAYCFRAFSKSPCPPDPHLLLSLWGRIDFLLPRFPLLEAAIVVQGYDNDIFRNNKYEEKVLVHILLLIENRPEWTRSELAHVVTALLSSPTNELREKIRLAIAQYFPDVDIIV